MAIHQGSATYGAPSNIIWPATFSFAMIKIHEQPRRNVPHFLVETFLIFVPFGDRH